jgi:hypothetical protein
MIFVENESPVIFLLNHFFIDIKRYIFVVTDCDFC